MQAEGQGFDPLILHDSWTEEEAASQRQAAMAAQQPERHHYVPAFYLAVFEEPRDRYARPQKPSLRSTPSSRYTLMNASTSVAKVSDIWRRPLLKLWMGLHKHCDAGN